MLFVLTCITNDNVLDGKMLNVTMRPDPTQLVCSPYLDNIVVAVVGHGALSRVL